MGKVDAWEGEEIEHHYPLSRLGNEKEEHEKKDLPRNSFRINA